MITEPTAQLGILERTVGNGRRLGAGGGWPVVREPWRLDFMAYGSAQLQSLHRDLRQHGSGFFQDPLGKT